MVKAGERKQWNVGRLWNSLARRRRRKVSPEAATPLSELGEHVLPFPQPLPPRLRGRNSSQFPSMSPFYHDPDLLTHAWLHGDDDRD